MKLKKGKQVIEASEKAYNLIYKKQGYKVVKETAIDETKPNEGEENE
ncbi:MAG: hypothetical protein ACRC30_11050 [Clostridium sp.]